MVGRGRAWHEARIQEWGRRLREWRWLRRARGVTKAWDAVGFGGGVRASSASMMWMVAPAEAELPLSSTMLQVMVTLPRGAPVELKTAAGPGPLTEPADTL